MKKTKKESFFWTSYSDLMTSMFFVMLVLFVFMSVLFQKKIKEIKETSKTVTQYLDSINELKKEHKTVLDAEKEKTRATQKELDKIKEIEESIKNIDSRYFEYDPRYKRHTLKNITVSFRRGSSNIYDIQDVQRTKLLEVGRSIQNFVVNTVRTNPNVKYLLIVEGQSSKDNYPYNYELSYQRALALVRYWSEKDISFDANHCEIIISGSGDGSPFRVQPDNDRNAQNQRFVIHIIPKPGIIESNINQAKKR